MMQLPMCLSEVRPAPDTGDGQNGEPGFVPAEDYGALGQLR